MWNLFDTNGCVIYSNQHLSEILDYCWRNGIDMDQEMLFADSDEGYFFITFVEE